MSSWCALLGALVPLIAGCETVLDQQGKDKATYSKSQYGWYDPKVDDVAGTSARVAEKLLLDADARPLMRPELCGKDSGELAAIIGADLSQGVYGGDRAWGESVCRSIARAGLDADDQRVLSAILRDCVIEAVSMSAELSDAAMVREYLAALEARGGEELEKAELRVYLSGLEIWKNYDFSGSVMELYWAPFTVPDTSASENFMVRELRATVGSRVLNNFLLYSNEVVLNRSGTDSARVGVSVFDGDGFASTDGQKLDNVVSELQAGLENLDPTLGALRYIPFMPLIYDLVDLVDADDHVITAFVSLHASEYYVPNEQDLRVSINDPRADEESADGRNYRVILYFSVEVAGVRLYHPRDRHWRIDHDAGSFETNRTVGGSLEEEPQREQDKVDQDGK